MLLGDNNEEEAPRVSAKSQDIGLQPSDDDMQQQKDSLPPPTPMESAGRRDAERLSAHSKEIAKTSLDSSVEEDANLEVQASSVASRGKSGLVHQRCSATSLASQQNTFCSTTSLASQQTRSQSWEALSRDVSDAELLAIHIRDAKAYYEQWELPERVNLNWFRTPWEERFANSVMSGDSTYHSSPRQRVTPRHRQRPATGYYLPSHICKEEARAGVAQRLLSL